MTQRKRKQLTVAAQRAWSAADPRQAGGFVPVEWYARRNPRCKRRVFTDEIGRYEGFCMSAGGGFIAVLHSR